jgi:hypothetical protein
VLIPRLPHRAAALWPLLLAAQDQAPANSGYTLFTPMLSGVTYLLDAAGETVHTWTSDLPSAGPVVLLSNGNLLRSVRQQNSTTVGGGQGGRLQLLQPDGTVVWDFVLADERLLQHHDIEPTPHGTILLIAWERKSAEETAAAGRDPALGAELWSEAVIEIEPHLPDDARVVWEWHLWDHLVQERFPEKANFGSVAEHPERLNVNSNPLRSVGGADLTALGAIGYGGTDEEPPSAAADDPRPRDWIHANALSYDPETDRILLCSRGQSEIWAIDHSTTVAEAAGHAGGRYGRGGDFLARWGNPTNVTGDIDGQWLSRPHDAHWIPYGLPGYGNILVFNNGPPSEVIEFRDPLVGLDTSPEVLGAASQLRFVWTCSDIDGQRFGSPVLSGAQRLANGNTLVTVGTSARLVELTPEGRSVWEYRHEPRPGESRRPPRAQEQDAGPGRLGIFRATRIAPDHPGLTRLLGQREDPPPPR